MKPSKKLRGKKYFTVAEANATLPLVRSIVTDITILAKDLRDRHERLIRLRSDKTESLGRAYNEELEQIEAAFKHDQEKMEEYEQELRALSIELKDYFMGLIDFPCMMDDREVYLCWRLGETDVSHWHEIDEGFAGRQKLGQKVSQV